MTLHRLRDESGAALGLAVILVVLIGVMAAGLLTVLRASAEGTIQANRGQRAFAVADAGAQAAAARLRADATPEHYDATPADNSEWSYLPSGGAERAKTLASGADTATVTVRYLLPARTPSEQIKGTHAPELVPKGLPDYPDRDFFLAVSEGSSGETRRKVEAILCAKGSGDGREVILWSWREAYE